MKPIRKKCFVVVTKNGKFLSAFPFFLEIPDGSDSVIKAVIEYKWKFSPKKKDKKI